MSSPRRMAVWCRVRSSRSCSRRKAGYCASSSWRKASALRRGRCSAVWTPRAGKLMLRQRSRERLEAEQDLRAQEHRVESARATIEQSDRRLGQLSANYRAQLRAERIEAERERSRAAQELEKLLHRRNLAELR